MTESESSPRRRSNADYVRLLDDFRATDKAARECVQHLQQLGYSHGQARNAVYRYRRGHGLSVRAHPE